MRVVEAVAGSDKRPLSFMTFEVFYFDVVFHLIHVENIERNQRTFVCVLSTLATMFGREETGAKDSEWSPGFSDQQVYRDSRDGEFGPRSSIAVNHEPEFLKEVNSGILWHSSTHLWCPLWLTDMLIFV